MYMFTVGNNPESSIERLLVHVAPIAFYVIALTLGKSSIMPKNILLKKVG